MPVVKFFASLPSSPEGYDGQVISTKLAIYGRTRTNRQPLLYQTGDGSPDIRGETFMPRLQRFAQLLQFMNQHEVYYNINISLKNKYIYFETAKAACTTIKRTLMNLELESTNYRPSRVHLDVFSTPFVKLFQLDFDHLLSLLDSDDYFKFCFVRNPYTRILSCYLDKIAGNKPQKRKILKLLNVNANDIEQKIGFETFVDAVGRQEPKEMDQHWRTQHYQLFGDLVAFDYIGRVESIEEDLNMIDDRLGGIVQKHHEDVLWHQTDARNQLTQYYNDTIARKVLKIYSIDFEKYGYNQDWRAA